MIGGISSCFLVNSNDLFYTLTSRLEFQVMNQLNRPNQNSGFAILDQSRLY